MSRTLCFIPARGGSKRLPRKNLLSLGGKPLLSYTTSVARESGVFDDVVVSSDDAEILEVAKLLGATGDARLPELSGDEIRFVEVLTEFLLRPENRDHYDTIAVLLPTCPFRICEDVRAAFALHRETNQPVISVSEYDFPVQFAADLAADGHTLSLRNPEAYRRSTQSQSVPKSYHPNGAIYLSGAAAFLAAGTFFSDPVCGYVMPPERSLDIDHPHQLALAEASIAGGCRS